MVNLVCGWTEICTMAGVTHAKPLATRCSLWRRTSSCRTLRSGHSSRPLSSWERGRDGYSQGNQDNQMSLCWPEVSQTLMCITSAPRKPVLKKHNIFMLCRMLLLHLTQISPCPSLSPRVVTMCTLFQASVQGVFTWTEEGWNAPWQSSLSVLILITGDHWSAVNIRWWC